MRKTLLVYDIEKEREKFLKSVEILKNGGIVVFPTETVYGLGANAFNESAVNRIFQAKGRPSDNPLIVHIYSQEFLPLVVKEVNLLAIKLFEIFSPGPLTVVLPKVEKIPFVVTAGLETVAVRIPSHPVAREILKLCNFPVAAPSANKSGRPSPTTFEMAVREMNGRVDAIINGGMCEIGLESTVVKIEGDRVKILRPGFISKEMIEDALGGIEVVFSESGGEKVESPGVKYTHYKPKAKVVMCEPFRIESSIIKNSDKKIGVIVFKSSPLVKGDIKIVRVSSLEDYAKSLYKIFYECDRENVKLIIAEKVEEKGLGKAIMNRLKKASGGEEV